MTALPRTRLSRAVLIERLPGYAGQALLLALVAWLAWRGVANFLVNAHARGLSIGFGFLHAEAGFEIAQSLIAFSPASSYADAVLVATLNTLLVIGLAGFFSTLIALCVAFGRLASHPLIRDASAAYVEVFRNIPLLLQIFFWYFSAMALLPGVADSLRLGTLLLNNRGLFFPRVAITSKGAWMAGAAFLALVVLFAFVRRWQKSKGITGARASVITAIVLLVLWAAMLRLMPAELSFDEPRVEGFDIAGGFVLLPELVALTLGLSIYNSTFLAEIFRAGILSVPRGQLEAAATVGLGGARAALLITLPQALRVALPPAAGQYQTLAKASSLAAAIGYPDIMQIVGGTVLSQTSQALEAMTLVVLLYAAINLVIAFAVNLANRRLLRREGR